MYILLFCTDCKRLMKITRHTLHICQNSHNVPTYDVTRENDSSSLGCPFSKIEPVIKPEFLREARTSNRVVFPGSIKIYKNWSRSAQMGEAQVSLIHTGRRSPNVRSPSFTNSYRHPKPPMGEAQVLLIHTGTRSPQWMKPKFH